MRAVIMAGGEFVSAPHLIDTIKTADLLLAADAGLTTLCDLGFTPALVIGDLDSTEPGIVARASAHGCEVIRYSPHKDFSDTELAVEVAVERGADEVVLMGALGGSRLDHLLANVGLLASPLLIDKQARIVDDRHELRLVRDRMVFWGTPGDMITLLPFGGEVGGVTTYELLYPLNNATIQPGSTWGLSNVMLTSRAEVEITSGLLLTIHRRETCYL